MDQIQTQVSQYEDEITIMFDAKHKETLIKELMKDETDDNEFIDELIKKIVACHKIELPDLDMPLYEYLNENNINSDGDILEQFDGEGFNPKDVTQEIGGRLYLDDHPEGYDRGGWVPYLERKGEIARYDIIDGEWYQECNKH